MRFQQIIELCKSIEAERSPDKLLLLIAELRQLLSNERTRIEKILNRNNPAELVLHGHEGTCSICKNVFFYLRDDRFWDESESEAVALLQKQFELHLSTIHALNSRASLPS